MRVERLAECIAFTWCAVAAASAAEPRVSLATAVEQGDHAIVRQLLDQGADVNAAQVDGMTALHWAAYRDDFETAKQIVAAGGDVRAENRYGVTPLSLACTNGNSAIVELLLGRGADPNATLRGGETGLMTAARTGKLGPVQALLSSGADVNAKERNGQTALMWAAAEGNVDVVKALMDAGADVGCTLPSGFTAMFFAVREGRIEVVRALLDAGEDVNQVMRSDKGTNRGPRNGTSSLILAVENGHFELASILLQAGADPNEQRTGFAALHAISWVRKPIRGDGDPPPIGSGSLSSLELVRQLVSHGADVNVRHKPRSTPRGRLNRTDATPFLLASKTADVPLMRSLLELGADASLSNADHSTPLLAAAGVGALGNGEEAAATEAEALAAVGLLLEIGADINAVDDQGETAMHGAAYQSRAKMVQFLAENRADSKVWNCQNRHGWTPLMIAEGHRPGNFRPSPVTAAAFELIMPTAHETLSGTDADLP